MKIPDQIFRFDNSAGWRAWLADNHSREKEAWLILDKAHVPDPNLSLPEAIEEALCFGWVDSILQRRDADTYVLRFTPRKPRSIWSTSNQERVARLIEQGRMTEAGMARVTEAKANGEWEEAARREDVTDIPEEFARALASSPAIQARFDALPASQKRMFLYRIKGAKTSATRERRVIEAMDMLEQGHRFGQ